MKCCCFLETRMFHGSLSRISKILIPNKDLEQSCTDEDEAAKLTFVYNLCILWTEVHDASYNTLSQYFMRMTFPYH